MSKSHDKLPTFFWVQLALAALVGVIFLITFFQSGFKHDALDGGNIEKTAKNLEPVGAVSTKDAQASGSAKTRSGEEVYKASCQACHATGVANAPKPDDKAAWEPRVATGLDALIKTAVNGKGAMPARGGNPAVTDEEIKAVILYMTGKAGFDLSSAKKVEATPTATAQKEVQPPMPAAVANAIKKAPEPPQKMPEAVATAIAAVSAPTAPSAPAAPSAPKDMNEVPAKPTTPETSTEKMEKTEVAVASTTNATDSNTDNEKGKKVYKSACFACHDAGVAGSPKIGDKAAWAPRIATGNEALYVSAINGKGVMPPKGGNMGLSDDAVKSAVNYMMAQSK